MNHERWNEWTKRNKIKGASLTWIDDVLKATEEAESPVSFMRWSCLAAISATVRNKVWLDKQLYNLYPNIYVFLVGPSGIKKGFPVAVSKALVRAVGGTRVISGRNSIQAIIKELATTSTTPNGDAPITHSSAYINSGEFSTSLVKDPDALTILTDLFDGHYNPEWKNTLKGSGVETLKGVNITLLGAMNPTHFNDLITAKEISGGFIARCALIQESKRARKNSLLRKGRTKFKVEDYTDYLKILQKLEGPFEMAESAIQHFEDWYYQYEAEEIDDKTGTANRIHDQILKVSMLIALSRAPILVINKEDLEEAMDLCLSSTVAVGKITAGSGSSANASQMRIVMQELLAAKGGEILRSKILRSHYGDFSAPEFDSIVETLETAKAIDRRRTKDQKDIAITLLPHIIEDFERILKGGKKAS